MNVPPVKIATKSQYIMQQNTPTINYRAWKRPQVGEEAETAAFLFALWINGNTARAIIHSRCKNISRMFKVTEKKGKTLAERQNCHLERNGYFKNDF